MHMVGGSMSACSSLSGRNWHIPGQTGLQILLQKQPVASRNLTALVSVHTFHPSEFAFHTTGAVASLELCR